MHYPDCQHYNGCIYKHWSGGTDGRPPATAGTLIGVSTVDVTIENVSVTGGRVCARAARSSNRADAIAGGFIGEAAGGHVSIINSRALSAVTAISTSSGSAATASAGGMIGRVNVASVTIENSYAGDNRDAIIASVDGRGVPVESRNNGRAGGLIGENLAGTVTIRDSYVNFYFDPNLPTTNDSRNHIRLYPNSTNHRSYRGDFLGRGAAGHENSFSRSQLLGIGDRENYLISRGWDFENVWELGDNHFPTHRRNPHFIVTFPGDRPHFYKGELPRNLDNSMRVFYSPGLAAYRDVTSDVRLRRDFSQPANPRAQLVFESGGAPRVAGIDFELRSRAAQQLTINPAAITINNANHTHTINVGDTGRISFNRGTLPENVQLSVTGENTITVTYTPPAPGQPTVTGTHTVTVLREGISTPLTVTVNLTPAQLGDVNNDGQINIADLTTLRLYLSGRDVAINLANANLNNDAYVNADDAELLRRYLAGHDETLR